MKIIDSHFHTLLMSEQGVNVDAALSTICSGIDAGTEFNDLEPRTKLLANHPEIKIAAGMGPWETENISKEKLDLKFKSFKADVEKYNPYFIGEFGIDNHWNYGPAQLQEYLMELNMNLASEQGKKVLIHNREADSQIMKIIRNHTDVSGVIHCFSGNRETLKTALDFGYYISYAGNVTYKSNSDLRDTLNLVPINRLLLETDSPYLAPIPERGHLNTPANIIHTYKCVADFLNITVETLAEKVYENFNDFCRPLS